jgi:hypothetical protein
MSGNESSVRSAADAEVIVMTVYQVTGDRVDVTNWGDKNPTFVLGYLTARAFGGGQDIEYRVQMADRVCVGDTFTVERTASKGPGL